MNEHDIIQKAFSDLHASDDTLLKVMNRAHSGKSAKGIPKRIAIVAAVVVMVLSMALIGHGTVLLADLAAPLTPAADPEQIIDDAFGNTINTEKAQMYDAYGNPIALPDMERPAIDLAQAKKQFGDYISDVDAVVSVGESTFTLNNFMIDETGVGALTWTVENPNGVSYGYAGYGFVYFSWGEDPFAQPSIQHYGADGHKKMFASEHTALISENEEGTKLKLVSYFGTFDPYEIGDHFVWQVSKAPNIEVRTVQITPVRHIPAKKMTAANGMKLSVGSQGLVFDVNSSEDFNTKKIVLHFKDGTQYCVEDWDEMILNSSGGLWRSSEAYHHDDLVILYNRLVDTNAVTSVDVTVKIAHEKLVGEDYEVEYEYKNYVFTP